MRHLTHCREHPSVSHVGLPARALALFEWGSAWLAMLPSDSLSRAGWTQQRRCGETACASSGGSWQMGRCCRGGRLASVRCSRGRVHRPARDWEPAVGDHKKLALMAGRVASTKTLASGAPADTAEAVESDLAVVVVVTRHPYQTLGACSLVGARRRASLSLAAPLGERAVLEVQQGLPVSVTLTP